MGYTSNYNLQTWDPSDYGDYVTNYIAGTSNSTTSNMKKIDDQMKVNADGVANNTQYPLKIIDAQYISTGYYEATISGYTSYSSGNIFMLRLDTTVAGTTTLNINSIGTLSLMKFNTSGVAVNLVSGDLVADVLYIIMYDGTQWVLLENGGNKSLLTVTQTLTNGEKQQLATNGGIVSVLSQTLTTGEKTQVRTNISAITASDLLTYIFPVGSLYFSVVNTSPASFLGGTWAVWGTGRVPVGYKSSDSNFNTIEKTGGESTHALTANENGPHTHTQLIRYASGADTTVYGYTPITSSATATANSGLTQSSGFGTAHNNLQPYITCYMWKRTA